MNLCESIFAPILCPALSRRGKGAKGAETIAFDATAGGGAHDGANFTRPWALDLSSLSVGDRIGKGFTLQVGSAFAYTITHAMLLLRCEVGPVLVCHGIKH